MSDEKDEKLENEAETPEHEARRGGEAARARRRSPQKKRRGSAETTTTAKRETVAAPRDSEGRVSVRAQAKYVRCAPRKARLVVDHIRGKSVDDARAILATTPRAAARDVLKLLDSAVANAENNHELVADELTDQEGLRGRGADAQAVPAARPGPRHADPQANQPHDHPAHNQGRRSREHGTEGPPRVHPRRLHPRLEVELVQRAQLRRLPARGHPHPRPHREQARARRPVGHHDQEERERDRGEHPHRAPGHRDRQVGQRGGRPPARPAQAHEQGRQGEHPRDQAARARRQARGPVDRRAAAEPRRLPARDEALADVRDALRREGREGSGLGPAGRRRDGPHRGLLGRPRPAPHDARRHRLRLPRGAHDLRPHRREGLDQQGRDHAQGLRVRPDAARRAAAGERRRWRRRARPRRPRRRTGRWPRWTGRPWRWRRSRRRPWPAGRRRHREGGPRPC